MDEPTLQRHPVSSEDRTRFLDAMSQVAMTVSVVTTGGTAGRDGLVVSAMAPVSVDMERPRLLICVNAASRPAHTLVANGVFCVNVLSDRHVGLSDRFAGRKGGPATEWFEDNGWSRLQSASPALDGALANFDCEIECISPMGTHLVIFGGVLAVRVAPGQPLLHANRSYHRISPL